MRLMNARTKRVIKKAVKLIKAGQADAAMPILVKALRDDDSLEEAWYLLSFTLPSSERQVYALQQALRANPNFEQARQRLEALTGSRSAAPSMGPEATLEPPLGDSFPFEGALESKSPEPEPPAPPEPAPTPKLAEMRELTEEAPTPAFAEEPQRPKFQLGVRGRMILLVGFGIILIAVAFYFGRTVVSGLLTFPTATPTATEPAGFRELPPTWTPTGQESGQIGTPAPAAPTTGGVGETGFEPQLVDTNTLAAMLDIQDQVAALRGLDRQGDVENALVTGEQAARVLESVYTGADPAGDLADYGAVLAALGLLPQGYDLAGQEMSDNVDEVGGFYVPSQGRIYLVAGEFGPLQDFIYSHEFDHALVDQNYDLEDFGPDEECADLSDACRAARALAEGDATLISTQWLSAYAGNEVADAVLAQDQAAPEGDPAPPFLAVDLAFSYKEGVQFTDYLFLQGGWARVNAAYVEPPSTTEQIMHPEKYMAGEGAQYVAPAPVGDALGAGWRALPEGSLGEWLSYLVLSQGADEAARLEEDAAHMAAAGWGGDRVQAFVRPAEGGAQAAVAVHWVGDDEAEGVQFMGALGDQLGRRFAKELSGQLNGRCWEGGDQASCLYRRGAEVLWLLAPDMDLVAQMRGAFSLFN